MVQSPAGDSGGAGPQRPVVVAIGASNLSRGLSRLAAVSQVWAGGPIDLVIAAGHGRSYGANSRVWNRRLPSVLGCGLWRSLDRLLDAEAAAVQRRVAVLTDIGNDLLYGFSVAQLASWVEETLVRLRQRGFRVAVTRLPLASIATVGPFRYRLLKTLFVPGCPLSLEQIKDRSAAIDQAVVHLAAEQTAAVIDQPAAWYGVDAIHVQRQRLDELWQSAVNAWEDNAAADRTPADHSWLTWARVGSAAAEVGSLNHMMRFTPQPVVQLPDSTRVFLY
jgi:hypothetical protein